jgi:hypothetical protein
VGVGVTDGAGVLDDDGTGVCVRVTETAGVLEGVTETAGVLDADGVGVKDETGVLVIVTDGVGVTVVLIVGVNVGVGVGVGLGNVLDELPRIPII